MTNRFLKVITASFLTLCVALPAFAKFDMSDERTAIKDLAHVKFVHSLLGAYLKQRIASYGKHRVSDVEARNRAGQVLAKIDDICSLMQIALFAQKKISLYPDDSEANRKLWTALKVGAIEKLGIDYGDRYRLYMATASTAWIPSANEQNKSMSVASEQLVAYVLVENSLDYLATKGSMRDQAFKALLQKCRDSRALIDAATDVYAISNIWSPLPEVRTLGDNCICDYLDAVDKLLPLEVDHRLRYLSRYFGGSAALSENIWLMEETRKYKLGKKSLIDN